VLQVQLVKAALPAGEFDFDGQALHFELAEAPTAVEYVLVPQSVHATNPVNACYFPAAHAMHVLQVDPLQTATRARHGWV
jgi:hypothetical protein